MKIKFLATALLSGVLASVVSAHPGHGEPGWVHEHSATVIAATVVGVVVLALLMHAAFSATTKTFETKSQRVHNDDN